MRAQRLKHGLPKLAFVDQRTVEQRAFLCAEELRLNRRLRPICIWMCVTSPPTGPIAAPEVSDRVRGQIDALLN